ncbi:hypothetical protein V1512DRAFT_208644 [Lipomyces arxii]|uniref:uncharacterized protein n=1 Tax=Lipomyces arxii TaxID=56418 RepID=UPI0034CF4293
MSSNTPPPQFTETPRYSQILGISSSSATVLRPLHPVQWSDIHPRDFLNTPPSGFPNNGGSEPYLSTKSRLSQVWLNRWTIVCILVLVKLLLFTNSLHSSLESARINAHTACQSIEIAGSGLVSMPHYVSKASNELIAQGIEASVDALVATLELLVVGVEEITVFTVNLVTGTYVCLLTMAVTGSVSVVLNATESIISWVNETLHSIIIEIDSEVDSFNSALKNVEGAVENIGGFFTGSNPSWPTLSIPGLGALTNLTIPGEINDKLNDVERHLPNFEDVQNATFSAIREPFQKLRNVINSSLADYQFDRSLLKVTSKDTINVCSEDSSIDDFFDELVSVVATMLKTAVVAACVIGVLAMVPMGYLDFLHWKKLRKNIYILSRTLSRTDKDLDPIDSFDVAVHPLPQSLGLYVTRPVKSMRNRALIRWVIAYITYPPAMFGLTLGVTSLIAASIQIHILNALRERTPELASNVGNMTNLIASTVQSKAISWADQTNIALANVEVETNEDLFGWVTDATSSVNNTLNTFVDEMMGALNDVFGGTPLYTPIKDVLDCLLLLKIRGIQHGLTWAHDNAHVSFPRVGEDVITSALLLPSNSTNPNIASNRQNSATLDSKTLDDLSYSTADTVETTLIKVEEAFAKSIALELYLAGGLIGLWGFVVLIALLWLAFAKYSDRRNRAKKNMEEKARNDPDDFESITVPRPLHLPTLVAERARRTPDWVPNDYKLFPK